MQSLSHEVPLDSFAGLDPPNILSRRPEVELRLYKILRFSNLEHTVPFPLEELASQDFRTQRMAARRSHELMLFTLNFVICSLYFFLDFRVARYFGNLPEFTWFLRQQR